MGAACRAAFAFQQYWLADGRRIGWTPIYRPSVVFVGWEHGAHFQPAAEVENTESAQKCACYPCHFPQISGISSSINEFNIRTYSKYIWPSIPQIFGLTVLITINIQVALHPLFL